MCSTSYRFEHCLKLSSHVSNIYPFVCHNYNNRDNLARELYDASYDGRDKEVLALLKKGAPPNSDYYKTEYQGRTPLMMACEFNHPSSAEYLIKCGARLSDTNDLRRWTPLHYACDRNSTDCVQVLLKYNTPKGEIVSKCLKLEGISL